MANDHNIYFREVSCGGRKSCPSCHAKLNGNPIISMGYYHNVKWNTLSHFCQQCWPSHRQRILESHSAGCGCKFNFIGYQGFKLQEWMLQAAS